VVSPSAFSSTDSFFFKGSAAVSYKTKQVRDINERPTIFRGKKQSHAVVQKGFTDLNIK